MFAQPTTAFTIELTDAIFQTGAIGISKNGKPQGAQKPIRTAQPLGDSVTLKNVEWTEVGMAVGILDVDGPVTIENCRMEMSMRGMSLVDIKGSVGVRNNSFNFPIGITFTDCAETVTVEGNTFAQHEGTGPDVWVVRSRALVQNNVMPDGLLLAPRRTTSKTAKASTIRSACQCRPTRGGEPAEETVRLGPLVRSSGASCDACG